MNLKQIFGGVKTWLVKLPLVFKIVIPVAVLGLGYFGYTKLSAGTSKVTYLTEAATKGTLMTSISASGTITSGDTTYITTGASGTVNKVYAKNGDTVAKNQKIADITLDDVGQETQTIAWNNYEEAQVSYKNAITQKSVNNINMLQKKEALDNAETAQRDAHSGGWNPQTNQPYTDTELSIVDQQYVQAQSAYAAAQKDYAISDTNIALAQAKASAAYRNYQKVSSTIYAPAAGILQNLTLASGVTLGSSSSTSITVSTGTDSSSNSQSVSSQQVGAVKNPEGRYQATVTLTEVDVTTVKSGQKVTLTMDAYPNATLTGTVLAVNTSGSVSQGVTSYTATILLDSTTLDLYTNMAVNATIITSTETDVLLVPNAAVQTSNSGNYVQMLKDNKVVDVAVEIGNSNDTQTAITSGLNEGDKVITSINSATTTTKKTTSSGSSSTSIFRTTGGFGGGPGF